MAKTTIVKYFDDLDRKKGVDTEGAVSIVFSYDGRFFSIDLASNNRKAFEQALAPYIEAAEPLSGAAARSLTPTTNRVWAKPDPAQRKAMRQWWHDNWEAAGLSGPQTRGSIPAAVVEAYHKHHGMAVRKTT
jgi:hypothetical protein